MIVIQQIFYCFTYYDNVPKKRLKSNFNTYKSALTYRNELLIDKRYSHISDIFTDRLDI